MKQKLLFITLTVNCIFIGECQDTSTSFFIENYLLPLKKHEINHLEKKKESIKDSFFLKFIECQIERFKYRRIRPSTFLNFQKTTYNTSFKKSLFYINTGDFLLINQPEKAIDFYERSYDLSKTLDNPYLVCEIQKRLCSYYSKTQKKEYLYSFNRAINKYRNYVYDDFEKFHLEFYSLIHKMQLAYSNDKTEIYSYFFYDLIELAKNTKSNILLGDAYQLTGVNFLLFNKNTDSTLKYFLRAKEKFYSDSEAEFYKAKNLGIDLNLIKNSFENGDLKKSVQNLKKLENTSNHNEGFRIRLTQHQFFKDAYVKLGDFEKAYYHQSREKEINDSLNLIKVIDIDIKYDTERKEEENKMLKKEKLNLIIGSITFISLLSLIAFISQKSIRRKQKLAEQEKALQTQKLATVLKEQELMSIDAMIEGQEKERQRIANDLHDDLGGLMATVKLHFNALKDKQTPELFDKTTHLLDEAYQKIRSIAHAKNSGVIAKQGLLKAINNMADKISSSNKISIHVMDYGLENRLENSLELTIFRIIQELVTNIIKHADATEATIHLTNHKESLNIMVEDNGTGFNPSQITTKNKGMGISSIDKRVAYLEGTMAIESDEVNKGTTIIIDIPI